MYIPPAFRESDTARLHEFIESYGFAVLTNSGPQGLVASHLPLLLDRNRGPYGTLLGHFAKANKQVTDLGQDAMAIFSGPHTYVSPTWYEEPNTVPTWNYVAVHAYGKLKRIESEEALKELLRALVTKYESGRPVPWQYEPESPFQHGLLGGIVGFEIEITRLEGKWKLNQNHSRERRERVIAALTQEGGHDHVKIARLMEASLPRESDG